jgi:general secretion pathway protein C
MQDLIKRNFWVLGAVVAMTCAVFAAKAATHVAESAFFGDAEHGPKITPVVAQQVVVAKPVHSKDGAAMATRDIFCSDCKPVEPTPVAAGSNATGGPAIIYTSLPLQLLATNVGARPSDSFASIVNTATESQGSFGLGDKVPGATGAITAIHYQSVDFENSGHTERLTLLGVPPPPIVAAAPELPTAGSDGDDLQASIDGGIKKIDENTFEIDRALVDKVMTNPMAVAKGARIVPAVKNGKPDGFKLYAIRPTSVYAKLGLTNGDTLESVNGMDFSSADKALEIYTKLKDATSLELDVTRRGKPITLKYTIR